MYSAIDENEKDMAALKEKLGAATVDEVLATINRCKEREENEKKAIENIIDQIPLTYERKNLF